MSSDELKVVTISALNTLLSSHRIFTPSTSLDLLTRIMTTKTPHGLLPTGRAPRFRLTDLVLFEAILEDLAQTWTDGRIALSREPTSGEMTIWEVSRESPGRRALADSLNPRKRKRVVDEDADSAAGDEEDEDENLDNVEPSPSSTLGSLSKELREVYAILQRSTAKGRLLAEQVCYYQEIL